MAQELVRLMETGTMRVLDLLNVQKNNDGSLGAMARDEAPALGAQPALHVDLAEVLATGDPANLCSALETRTGTPVPVWEDSWTALFTNSARWAGGQLVPNGRITIRVIVASTEAELALVRGEVDLPLRPRRAARRNVAVDRTTARTAEAAPSETIEEEVLTYRPPH